MFTSQPHPEATLNTSKGQSPQGASLEPRLGVMSGAQHLAGREECSGTPDDREAEGSQTKLSPAPGPLPSLSLTPDLLYSCRVGQTPNHQGAGARAQSGSGQMDGDVGGRGTGCFPEHRPCTPPSGGRQQGQQSGARHITGAGWARTLLGGGTLGLGPQVFGLGEVGMLWLSR